MDLCVQGVALNFTARVGGGCADFCLHASSQCPPSPLSGCFYKIYASNKMKTTREHKEHDDVYPIIVVINNGTVLVPSVTDAIRNQERKLKIIIIIMIMAF